MNLVEWLSINLALARWWVQALENLNQNFIFAKVGFGKDGKG